MLAPTGIYRVFRPSSSSSSILRAGISAAGNLSTPTSLPVGCAHTSLCYRQFGSARTMASNGGQAQGLRLKNPTIFVCDMQEKFQTAIHEFDKIVLTTQKLVSFASRFSLPVHTTTQTTAKLGPTVPSLASVLPSPPHDKTKFSMAIPSILELLPAESSVALVGIESHICITQTALDLRDQGHHVYVMADGVSSCNATEVRVALDRLRGERGVTVTSSESWMYEVVGDSGHAGFKGLIGVVKEKAGDTREVLTALPPKI